MSSFDYAVWSAIVDRWPAGSVKPDLACLNVGSDERFEEHQCKRQRYSSN